MKMPIEELKKLWKEFSEVPVDNEDNIERDFRDFPAGTDRFEVLSWFDDMCPNGMMKDLYGTENEE
jgi:hypothetical protein